MDTQECDQGHPRLSEDTADVMIASDQREEATWPPYRYTRDSKR